MSNVFNAKRFGNYLLNDIKSAWRDSGTMLILCAFAPLIVFILGVLFQLVFGGQVDDLGIGMKGAAIMLSFIIIAWVFPSKHYGPLTEKRYGSSWLMLPASRFEKFLSVLLVSCLVLPLAFFSVQFVVDKVLTLVPAYGSSVYSRIYDFFQTAWDQLRTGEGRGLAVSIPYALYIGFCAQILFFTLGAIFFKNSKIGKTFITLLILEIAVSLGMGGLLAATHIDKLSEIGEITEDQVINFINVFAYVTYIVVFAALDILIYLRIKTLKH